MTDTVRDAIAASIALEIRVVSTPEAPFGYGSDISCAYDVDPSAAEVTGTLLLAQAIVRRLDTPRGSLPDDKGYGISLRSMLNAGVTSQDIASMAGRISNEVKKDDRVDNVLTTVTPSATGDTLSVVLLVTPVDSAEEFTMTLAVTSGATLLEAIS